MEADDVKTTFQSSREWRPTIDNRADAVMVYGVGGNPEAARLSGIPSKNVLTFVYTLSGFMAGMAGIVSVGRLASANGNAGSTYDNDAIAACIVGGASFTGGKGTIWGTLIGGVARFLVHYVVGATIWAAYMPDTFFGMTMTSPWIYSLLYNIAYMGPNIIITLVIFGLLYVPMKKYMLGQDIR